MIKFLILLAVVVAVLPLDSEKGSSSTLSVPVPSNSVGTTTQYNQSIKQPTTQNNQPINQPTIQINQLINQPTAQSGSNQEWLQNASTTSLLPLQPTPSLNESNNDTGQTSPILFRRVGVEICYTYNVSNDIDDSKCSPGSMYVIFCQQCICPYKGSIMNFCRPMPKDFYCETPYENSYYLPVADRRSDNTTSGYTNNTLSDYTKRQKLVIPENFQHNHTIYSCSKRGKVMDECFICDCDESGSIIEEHCFKGDADHCKDSTPSFLRSASSSNRI